MLKRINLIFAVLLVVLLNGIMIYAGLDEAYLKKFGGGNIIVSGVTYPAFSKLDISTIDYEKDKSGKITHYIKGGPEGKLYIRVLNKDGKTLGSFIEKTKKDNPDKMKDYVKDRYILSLWSNYNPKGEKMMRDKDKWPEKLSVVPDWYVLAETFFHPAGGSADWDSFGWDWDKNGDDHPNFRQWLKAAKPGWKLYVVARGGFDRKMPEAKTWDSVNSRWEIPTETIYGEPFAAGTIIIKGPKGETSETTKEASGPKKK